jgi:hypothetical protein
MGEIRLSGRIGGPAVNLLTGRRWTGHGAQAFNTGEKSSGGRYPGLCAVQYLVRAAA